MMQITNQTRLMASKVDLASSSSSALVPYVSPRSRLEQAADIAARRSLNAAQFAATHLKPISETTEKAWPKRVNQLLPASDGAQEVRYSSFKMNIPPHQGRFHDEEIGVGVYAPEGGAKKPVLLFSHGWGNEAIEFRPLLQQISSHGYCVISLNHPSSAKEYPEPLSRVEEPKVAQQLAETQAHNIEYMVSQLRERGAEQIVLAGHSLGGKASIMVTQKDSDIAGCINLDGGISDASGIESPALTILADHLRSIDSSNKEDMEWVEKDYVPMFQNWVGFTENSNGQALQIPATRHTDFSASQRTQNVASQAIVQFLSSIQR